jgi:putative membrane protein
MEQTIRDDKKYLNAIKVLSVIIPLLVAILIFYPLELGMGSWVYNLPLFNAIINSTTSLLLIAAVVAIKQKKIIIHRNLMLASLVLGAIFLLSYVLYHSSVPSTVFGDLNNNGNLEIDEAQALGNSRSVYLFFLLTHIALSVVVVPFVLAAFYFALTNQLKKHTKIVKFTFPIWLYVSITGVIVYYLISPYYPF